MFKIVKREEMTDGTVVLNEIEAPLIARKARPGQFVVIRIDEKGERIPLTVADWDEKEGSVTMVCMEVGTTTNRLAALGTGDSIVDFVGPLGKPTEIEKFGTVCCVAGGFAVAVVMPIARALKEAGNRVISILGARNKELLFWEDELRNVSDELIITTDDGSYGRKGLVTEPLKEILESKNKADQTPIDLAIEDKHDILKLLVNLTYKENK